MELNNVIGSFSGVLADNVGNGGHIQGLARPAAGLVVSQGRPAVISGRPV
jgi:hypothetical protein